MYAVAGICLGNFISACACLFSLSGNLRFGVFQRRTGCGHRLGSKCGDAFFYGVLRIIATGIAIGLASQGNPLGPLLFLLIYNIPSLLLRYYGGVSTGWARNISPKPHSRGYSRVLRKPPL